jgi:glutathione S-transferase
VTLSLYYHPLSSFCHKVLIALEERNLPFERHIVNLGSPEARASLLALWPVGKIPVLRDAAADLTLPESSIIIEHLDSHATHAPPLLPADPSLRLEVRLWDRFFDQYMHVPMQKIVLDRLRGDGDHDPRGLAEAHAALATAYDMLEQRLAGRTWVAGGSFSLADCAAVPALFYANIVSPWPGTHAALGAYFEQLVARPSVSKVIDEARPFFAMFPFKDAMPKRFL